MEARKISAVVFSGGRGAASISKALVNNPQVELTVLVNAYDDGLSTGKLRAYLPGMLGPSDVRKNISSLMPMKDLCFDGLRKVLDYRLPIKCSRDDAYAFLNSIVHQDLENIVDEEFATNFSKINLKQAALLSKYIDLFSQYEAAEEARGGIFDFDDCSLGNIVFAGCYLDNNRNFNQTVKASADLCEVRASILNVTDGENLVLLGIRRDGLLLLDEAEIVSPQDASHVEEVFLLKNYLSDVQKAEVLARDKQGKIDFLKEIQIFPEANIDAINVLKKADLIVYGPGTQFSSLLPSYLTKGIAEVIAKNENAEKIFVCNIMHDHDIYGLSAEDLIKQLHFYMSRKGAVQSLQKEEQLVTQSFIQSVDNSNLNRSSASRSYVSLEFEPDESGRVNARDWELGAGEHGGGIIVSEMLQQVQRLIEVRIQPHRHMISIVVPVLDEVSTIKKVLSDIQKTDFSRLGMNKEIIVVDGGSTDGTADVIGPFSNIKSYRLTKGSGRGAAIRYGFSKARGNIVIIFPSDDEYEAKDILKVAGPIVENQFDIVFGSRMIKCLDLSRRIHEIYGTGNYSSRFISKYGGMIVSIVSLLLFNRFVSDPFSTLKAFDASVIRSMNLTSNGLDLEGEMIAKASRLQCFILEVPVEFKPRGKPDGKKTTLAGGIHTLLSLFIWKYRFFDVRNTDSTSNRS